MIIKIKSMFIFLISRCFNLALLSTLKHTLKISLHAPMYNNAVTTEAARQTNTANTVIYDIKITQGKFF